MILRELLTLETRNFYKNNPTGYLDEEAGRIHGATYMGVFDDDKIIAATSYVQLTDRLAFMQSTQVIPDYRGKGVGRFLNSELEQHLKKEGYGKIVSNIYVENLPSIILKLKIGYLIEGTLRDHDFVGQHEYILGKIL